MVHTRVRGDSGKRLKLKATKSSEAEISDWTANSKLNSKQESATEANTGLD